MGRQDWLALTDPVCMARLVEAVLTPRQGRLIMVACSRSLAPLLPPKFGDVVGVVEGLAGNRRLTHEEAFALRFPASSPLPPEAERVAGYLLNPPDEAPAE
jgi:hypothetical protein